MEQLFEKAVRFAMQAHAGQVRKDGAVYILHPLEDATIVGTMTNDPEVLAAAVLHDTVEDTPVTLEELRAAFGERVAELVAHETENKRPEMKASDSWRLRKEETLAILKDSGTETKMLWLGDKLSNMRAIARNYDRLGYAFFECFNQKDPRQQRWYHATILNYLSALKEHAAYQEYEALFHHVFDALTEGEDET